MPTSASDLRFMGLALDLAERVLGTTWPNPSVGCVIVDEGGDAPLVLGRGVTAPGGRPHAETQALEQAGGRARGATAYVSLEPCAHHGQTAPGADAFVEAGIGRVVIAAKDPDPRVSGKGSERLHEAGIEVTTGVLEARACQINQGFFSRILQGRPLLTLKIAASLDGRLATHSGESRWITAESARAIIRSSAV